MSTSTFWYRVLGRHRVYVFVAAAPGCALDSSEVRIFALIRERALPHLPGESPVT